MGMERSGWPRTALAAALIGLVAIIACGGDEASPTPTAPSGDTVSSPTPPVSSQPTATPTTTEAPTSTDGGELMVGVSAICPPTFIMKFVTGACFERLQMWGFMEGITWMEPAPVPIQAEEDVPEKSMLESWELDSENGTLTWTVKAGIPFQDERWGEVTAHDIAFSFQEAMAQGSTFNRAGQLREWIDSIEALDDRTVKIQCTDDGCQQDWIVQQSNYNGQTVSISSKKAFDDLGEENALASLGNSTGPFEPTRWLADEEISAKAVKPHWRHAPHIDAIKYVAIPEVSVRQAALATGEVHLADLPPRFVAEAVEATGGRSQQIGPGTGQGINFAGNYWASSDYLGTAGEGNDPAARPGYKPDAQHPWIGEWGNDESMERARKVRLAMAMMVDSELINEKILGGLGAEAYSFYGWSPEHPEWKEEWRIDYDPDGAQELLEEAGYPNGFEAGYWIPPDVASVIDPELAEGIAQMWVDGGLQPQIEKTAYSARRPTLVARSIDVPWAWSHSGVDSPKNTNAVGSHVPRAGSWNSGVEFPDEIGALWKVIENERDPDKKRELNAEVSDFANHWVLFANFVESTPLWAVRPEVVEWEPYTGNLPYFSNPQTIVLKVD